MLSQFLLAEVSKISVINCFFYNIELYTIGHLIAFISDDIIINNPQKITIEKCSFKNINLKKGVLIFATGQTNAFISTIFYNAINEGN